MVSQYSTVQHSTAQHSTEQNSTRNYSAALYREILGDAGLNKQQNVAWTALTFWDKKDLWTDSNKFLIFVILILLQMFDRNRLQGNEDKGEGKRAEVG
jgi:hypothetical protein